VPPSEHGIVGNGWYFRDECEVKFWRQSNKLVQAPKVWETARTIDPSFTCANLFWWYNMYSTVDVSVTPRPMYPADGRKIPDVYTVPADWRVELQEELGQFPLFKFWGPTTSIESSEWIVQAVMMTDERFAPTLTLVYLPHLDYNLQRTGPGTPEVAADLGEIDAACKALIEFYEARGVRVMLVSEYGIGPVSRPVHLNRVLRREGHIAVREELGRELLDPGASRAFAVADHQVAHVYVRDPGDVEAVRRLLEGTPGVDRVLGAEEKRAAGLDHERAGELVAVAEPDAWFTYYYWLDDRRAPDFARTVDIHRKPGYDPVEVFVDPALRFPEVKVGWTLMKKALGFRTLLDVVPLDATLVKGQHGRLPAHAGEAPVCITDTAGPDETVAADGMIEATAVHDLILREVFGPRTAEPRRPAERIEDGRMEG
jgi:predicted AlkP superfamily pyrophosphatase or phosphodiesterase